MVGRGGGSLCFLERGATGGGGFGGVRVWAMRVAGGRPRSELAHVMERVPQGLENVDLPGRRPIAEMPGLSREIQRVEAELGREGRVLVRWSGTEAKLRLMVEGPDMGRLEACLLYTSDAADERSSVDLGGRRIIKKKKNIHSLVAGDDQKMRRDDHRIAQ